MKSIYLIGRTNFSLWTLFCGGGVMFTILHRGGGLCRSVSALLLLVALWAGIQASFFRGVGVLEGNGGICWCREVLFLGYWLAAVVMGAGTRGSGN